VTRGNQLDSIYNTMQRVQHIWLIHRWSTGPHSSRLSISQGDSGRVCSHSSLGLGLANEETMRNRTGSGKISGMIMITSRLNAPEEVKL
jgi:hypothetical protein